MGRGVSLEAAVVMFQENGSSRSVQGGGSGLDDSWEVHSRTRGVSSRAG